MPSPSWPRPRRAPPAFLPSFGEPTPPPSFEAMYAEPAFAAPRRPRRPRAGRPRGGGRQDEEDEDLESFQAWLQSLKR